MKRRLLFDLFILSLFVSALLAGSILYFSMKDHALKTANLEDVFTDSGSIFRPKVTG